MTTLFGGEDASGVGETWEWDGLAWTMVANTGPSPRTLAAMSSAEGRGVTGPPGAGTAARSCWGVGGWESRGGGPYLVERVYPLEPGSN